MHFFFLDFSLQCWLLRQLWKENPAVFLPHTPLGEDARESERALSGQRNDWVAGSGTWHCYPHCVHVAVLLSLCHPVQVPVHSPVSSFSRLYQSATPAPPISSSTSLYSNNGRPATTIYRQLASLPCLIAPCGVLTITMLMHLLRASTGWFDYLSFYIYYIKYCPLVSLPPTCV